MVRLAYVVVCLAFAALPRAGRAENPQAPAEIWLAEYKKLGGKAGLSVLDGDEPTLWVEKQKDQKPLVSLKGLKPASDIRVVGLQGNEIDDDDLEALAGWSELKVIKTTDGKKITDKGIKAIAALRKLWQVELFGTAVTEAGLSAFSGHGTLTHLWVSNPLLENRVRRVELKNLPKLETITFSLDGTTAVHLSKMPQLRQVSDFPLEVESAELTDLGGVTDLDFRGSKLKKLTLSGVPKLESLDLRKTQMDEKAVEELKRAHPTVKILR